MRAVLKELASLGAIITFVVGIATVGTLIVEHNDTASSRDFAEAR